MRLRAHHASRCGPPRRAGRLLLDEAERVEPFEPGRAAALRLDASFAAIMAGEPNETLRLVDSVRPAGKLQVDSRLVGARCWAVRSFFGPRRSAALRSSGKRERCSIPASRADGSFVAPAGVAGAIARALRRGQRDARRRDRPDSRRRRADLAAYALVVLGHAEFHMGDWPRRARRRRGARAHARARPARLPLTAIILLAALDGAQGHLARRAASSTRRIRSASRPRSGRSARWRAGRAG